MNKENLILTTVVGYGLFAIYNIIRETKLHVSLNKETKKNVEEVNDELENIIIEERF